MKNLLFFALAFLIVSCSKPLKDVNDYFPEIQLVSVVIQDDGTVLATGEIVSEGAGAVEYAGFCCGTSDNPAMLDRQLIASVNGKTFTAVYEGFEPDSVYYFKAWANNEWGYAISSNQESLTGIIGVNVDPPCTPLPNTCDLGGGTGTHDYFDIDKVEQNFDTWDFTAATFTGPTVSFSFGSELTNGVFTTSTFTSPGDKQVFVSFYSGFISGSLSAGTPVYVNRLSPGVFEITICDAPWKYNNSTFYLKTQLVVEEE